MPILLQEDYAYPLPAMYRVRQHFPDEYLDDVLGAARKTLQQPEIANKVQPGMRVAVAVGSRGIRDILPVVKAVVALAQERGAHPFILSAMGSHGGGTPEGQREVLEGYGITEQALGVEVVTEIDTELLGTTSRGIEIYFDKCALAADLVVPVNRVKPHTDFVADIQSGLCKMITVGLGNHRGCSALHEEDFDHFGETLLEAAQLVMRRANIGFGVAIVENAHDHTALLEAIPAERLIEREKELVPIARANMPALMIPEIDVLVVEEIGKNISGAGYDPNILGKSYLLKRFLQPVPQIGRMVLLGISEESHGNAIGMGIFDVTTRAVFDHLDLESIYANAIAVKCPEDAKIPLVAADENEAVRVAVRCLRGADRKRLRIVRIKNTLELSDIWVSDALLETVEQNKQLQLLK